MQSLMQLRIIDTIRECPRQDCFNLFTTNSTLHLLILIVYLKGITNR